MVKRSRYDIDVTGLGGLMGALTAEMENRRVAGGVDNLMRADALQTRIDHMRPIADLELELQRIRGDPQQRPRAYTLEQRIGYRRRSGDLSLFGDP